VVFAVQSTAKTYKCDRLLAVCCASAQNRIKIHKCNRFLGPPFHEGPAPRAPNPRFGAVIQAYIDGFIGSV
jgi:hypothetical protein